MSDPKLASMVDDVTSTKVSYGTYSEKASVESVSVNEKQLQLRSATTEPQGEPTQAKPGEPGPLNSSSKVTKCSGHEEVMLT